MKIGIIGSGGVGSATAFLLGTSGVASKIILVNRTRERASAEALDISHALPIVRHCEVRAGDFSDLADFDIVVITCGTKRGQTGQSRLDLLNCNIRVYFDVMSNIARVAPQAMIIVVTNPVDVLAGIAAQIPKIDSSKIISAGTLLDSMRFEAILSDYFLVSRNEIKGVVLGEHGDSQVPIWSMVKISGEKPEDFASKRNIDFSEHIKNLLSEKTRFAADEIIFGKGATNYGIAGSVVKICMALAKDKATILPISTLHKNFENIGDVFISTPTTVFSNKIGEILPLEIDESEKRALVNSASVIHRHTQEATWMLRNMAEDNVSS